jgi:hypothetical protein
MPADVTWALIGYSFIPLALGSGMLFLAFRLAKRWWWRAPACLAAALLLAYWVIIVYAAALPTIHQTDGEQKCYRENADGELIDIDCSEREEWRNVYE